jgi:hypothetical protein
MRYHKFTLSDGTSISESHSLTGFKGSCFSPAWTDVRTNDRAFIANVSRERASIIDPRVNNILSGGQCLHIGTFSDPREAAYAAEHFMANVSSYMNSWNGDQNSVGNFKFPKDLYNLPYLTAEECKDLYVARSVSRSKSGKVSAKYRSTATVVDTRWAVDAYSEKYDMTVAKELWDKFGKELVKREFKLLQMTEFELRFGLI